MQLSEPPPTAPDRASLPAVPMGLSPVEKFKEFLDLRKLKCTDERLRIVEHIFKSHEHFDAEQLLERMRAAGLSASRPTVYRTLALLVDSGLLRQQRFGERAAYEHGYGYPNHEHFFCERCHKPIEFVSDELDALLARLAREHRFRALGRRLVINGVCEDCNKPPARRKLDMI